MPIQHRRGMEYITTNRAPGMIRYIVLHGAEIEGATAAEALSCSRACKSVHFIVDESHTLRCVREQDIALHCNTNGICYHPSCRNENSLAVLVCMQDRNGGVRQKSLHRTKELILTLMRKYHIPYSRVLRHFDVTGQSCPSPMVEDYYLWLAFQKNLKDQEKGWPIYA